LRKYEGPVSGIPKGQQYTKQVRNAENLLLWGFIFFFPSLFSGWGVLASAGKRPYLEDENPTPNLVVLFSMLWSFCCSWIASRYVSGLLLKYSTLYPQYYSAEVLARGPRGLVYASSVLEATLVKLSSAN